MSEVGKIEQLSEIKIQCAVCGEITDFPHDHLECWKQRAGVLDEANKYLGSAIAELRAEQTKLKRDAAILLGAIIQIYGKDHKELYIRRAALLEPMGEILLEEDVATGDLIYHLLPNELDTT